VQEAIKGMDHDGTFGNGSGMVFFAADAKHGQCRA
jgi:hypothetical protein